MAVHCSTLEHYIPSLTDLNYCLLAYIWMCIVLNYVVGIYDIQDVNCQIILCLQYNIVTSRNQHFELMRFYCIIFREEPAMLK